MRVYLVGGAVRDELLGLPVQERDWVVVGATTEQMLERGFRRADAEFPVFIHPQTGEEYALARTETKTGIGYKGFSVDSGTHVTLEQDLQRRDLTINALARDEEGRLLDPFGGQGDLERRLLRHVSPAFAEDPVRLLRLARFAARFGYLGFRVADETRPLLRRMAESRDLPALRRERIWKEMRRALREAEPWRFFEVLQECDALPVLVPQLASVIAEVGGGETPSVIAALKRAAAATDDPVVRFAVLFAPAADPADGSAALCEALRAPREYGDLLDMVVRYGALFEAAAEGDAGSILQLIGSARAEQQPERFQRFLQAAGALRPEAAVAACSNLEKALRVVVSVSADVLQAEGLTGAELGAELERRRLAAIRSVL